MRVPARHTNVTISPFFTLLPRFLSHSPHVKPIVVCETPTSPCQVSGKHIKRGHQSSLSAPTTFSVTFAATHGGTLTNNSAVRRGVVANTRRGVVPRLVSHAQLLLSVWCRPAFINYIIATPGQHRLIWGISSQLLLTAYSLSTCCLPVLGAFLVAYWTPNLNYNC